MKFGSFIAMRQILRNKKKSIPVFLCIFIAYTILVNIYGVYESYNDMIDRSTREEYGAYHCYFRNVTGDEKDVLHKSETVDTLGEEYLIGEYPVSTYNGKEIGMDQSVSFISMDEECLRLNMLRLVRGRLPEKDGEIIISAGMKLGKGTAYDTADEGDILELTDGSGKKVAYTVTGVLDNFDASENEGIYKAIVKMSSHIAEDYIGRNIYVTLTSGGDLISRLDSLAEELGFGDEQIFREGNRIIFSDEHNEGYRMIYNNPLLYLINEGSPDDAKRSVVYIAEILMAFILIINAMVIWNIFSIRIEERRKEYGLLRILTISYPHINGS